MRTLLRSIAALVLGYALIVALTSAGFKTIEVVTGRKEIWGSSPVVLLASTLVAAVAGLAGGYLAATIGVLRPVQSAALVLIPLALDSIYVLFFFKGTAPFWFDLMGALTLMACTLAGGYARGYFPAKTISPPTTV